LLPWAQAALPVAHYQGWITIFAAAGLWSALLVITAKHEDARAPGWLLAACLLALAPGWIAYEDAADSQDLSIVLFDAIIAAGVMFAGAAIATQRTLRSSWLDAGAAFGAILGAISLAAWLSGQAQPWTLFGMLIAHGAEASKPAGPFTNGNVMGAVAAAGFLLAWHRWRTKPRHWLGVAAAISLVAAWASMSRSLWVWLALASIGLAWELRKEAMRRVGWFVLALSPWLGWAIGSWGKHLGGIATAAWQAWLHTEQAGLGVRAALWGSGLSLALDAFPSGIGWGRLAAHYFDAQFLFLQAHPDLVPLQQAPRNMHDWPLHLFVEGGIFGLGMLAIASAALLRTAPVLRHLQHPRWPFAATAWLLALHGLSNLTLTRPFPLLLFLLCLGGALARQQKRASHRFRRGIAVAAAAASLALLPIASEHIRHWKQFERWLQMERGAPKAQLTKELLAYPSTMPLTLSIVIYEMSRSSKAMERFPELEPLMQRARKVQDFPTLDQGLLIAAFKAGRMREACQRGIWLRRGGWELTQALESMIDQACASASRGDASQSSGIERPAWARKSPSSATIAALSVQ